MTASISSTAARTSVSAWFGLLALTVAFMLAVVDRQIINLLSGPLKLAFAIDDTRFSLLQGLAFVVTYGLAALPLAWVADRGNRKHLAMACLLAWSVATAACAFAHDFWTLFALRALIGLGEAGIAPAAMSMLRGYFTPARLGLAISLFLMGAHVGNGLALGAGGFLIAWLQPQADTGTPWLGIEPWRAIFLLAGASGFIGLALLAAVREPQRPAAVTDIRMAEGFGAMLGRRWRVYVPFLCALLFALALMFGLAAWFPAFLEREHAWMPSQVGSVAGLAVGGGGIAGALLAGILAGFAQRRAGLQGLIKLLAATIVVAVGFGLPLVMTSPAAVAPLALGFFTTLGTTAVLGPIVLQALTPEQFAGRAVALYLLTSMMLAGAIGPTTVAALNDRVFDGSGLGSAMALTIGGFAALALLVLLVSRLDRENVPVPA